MAETFTGTALTAKLSGLDGWKAAADGTAITKSFALGDFETAIDFVNRIAELAKERDHHPDIDIRYDTVRLTLSTHSAGGVTKHDLGLAAAIDEATP
jgi:4a-hydroxytetrahydrobiopterin dehydratase